MKRDDLVQYLDSVLNLPGFSGDVSNNGLQLEGRAELKKILFSVDGCQEVFDLAVSGQADFIFVHHGLSWGGGIKRWCGIDAARFRTLFKHDISLYAAHLPLDAHPEFGNNAVLSKLAGLKEREKFFCYDGVEIGFCGRLDDGLSVKMLAEKIAAPLGGKYRLRGDENRVCRKAAIVSGGGGVDSVFEAARCGCDLLITGELEHIMHHPAAELGIAVIALGHYASETTGPRALMEHIAGKFDVECVFADCPTGL